MTGQRAERRRKEEEEEESWSIKWDFEYGGEHTYCSKDQMSKKYYVLHLDVALPQNTKYRTKYTKYFYRLFITTLFGGKIKLVSKMLAIIHHCTGLHNLFSAQPRQVR